jgi:hypothetical protein
MFAFSCSSKAEYSGLYKAQDTESKKYTDIFIDLKETGEGIWRVSDDEETFSWYVKGDELRLNTKLGGVIVGEIQDGTIVIMLAGRDKITFKKSK